MVNVSDAAYRQTAALMSMDKATGIDVDDFLSKCITYMRTGGPPVFDDSEEGPGPSTARRRTTIARQWRDADEEDEDETGELDFAFLGAHACFPYNSRPPVPSFLLGPLSVEKKVRKETQRRAKQANDTNAREARPEALTKDDLQQSDENGLTQICTRIRNQIVKHVRRAGDEFRKAGFTRDDVGTAMYRDWLREHRISGDLGVPLFAFVVNPRSFGQTVENMFYISFLIKEGSIGIEHDDEGLPVISESSPSRFCCHVNTMLMTVCNVEIKDAQTLEEKRKDKTSRHQAVFALDYATWKGLIEAFEVEEPMIPHRAEEVQAPVGERGWYT